jgi:hypothetical protein
MLRSHLTCAVAVTGLMIAAFAPARVQAMTLAAPASLGKVIHEANLVQDVSYACRRGWRRCGTLGPRWGYWDRPPSYAYSFYRPEPYYAYGYYQLKTYPAWWWGWRQPWWW